MDRLQRYDLLEPIARGGMGEVFRGRVIGEHGFEKVVAIKRIKPALSRDPEFVHRFVAEAKLTGLLSHANIVQVLDFSRSGEALFLVMEYIHGADLGQLLRASTEPLPLPIALHLASEALKGLVFAHERIDEAGCSAGTIHCDISPSNLLVSYAGEVKITDFGVAQALDVSQRRAHSARVLGKYRYMPPEQRRGSTVGPCADLYALAVVLCEMLMLDRTTPVPELAGRLRRQRADVPPALEELLQRATSVDSSLRPHSARAMLIELTRVGRDLPPVTAPDVGAWVHRLVPSRAAGIAPTFDGALRQLLGGRPGERTRTASARAGTPTASFVARPAEDGPTVWEPTRVLDRPRQRQRWLVALAASAGIVVGAGWVMGARPTPVDRSPRASAALSSVATPSLPVTVPAPPAPPSQAEPPAADARTGSTSPPLRRPPRRDIGFVNIYVGPWADVFVDGKRVGTTPLRALALPAGRHLLRLTNPAAKPREMVVQVTAGQTRLVDVDLEIDPHS